LDCSDFLYNLAFSKASFTGSIAAGSASGLVSCEFGELGSEESALDGFVEDKSLNGLNELGLLRFVEGKKVGFEGEMVLREESQVG
jgi:hypothetical protein